MTEETPQAAAGWYPHPSMANTQCYWDGSKWTDHVAPGGAPASPIPSDASNYRHALGVVLFGVVLFVIGAAMGDSASDAGRSIMGLGVILGVIALAKIALDLMKPTT